MLATFCFLAVLLYWASVEFSDWEEKAPQRLSRRERAKDLNQWIADCDVDTLAECVRDGKLDPELVDSARDREADWFGATRKREKPPAVYSPSNPYATYPRPSAPELIDSAPDRRGCWCGCDEVFPYKGSKYKPIPLPSPDPDLTETVRR